MNIKKNISLIVGIGIPLMMIVLVAAVIYVPRLFIHPEYDFLFSANEYSRVRYEVADGKLVKDVAAAPSDTRPAKDPKLFIYDVKANEAREVSFEEAQGLKLGPWPKSPDGFSIYHGGSDGDFFPFFSAGGDYSKIYLRGRNVSVELNLDDTNTYDGRFDFIGWIYKMADEAQEDYRGNPFLMD